MPPKECTRDLEAVITEYVMAGAAWNAYRPDGDFCFEGPLLDVYNEKRHRFILFRCNTNAEVQRKLAYVAGDIGTAQILEYGDWNARFRASLTLPVSIQRSHPEEPGWRTVTPAVGKARKPVVVEHKAKRRMAR
ncbi:hypothetical protein P6U16_08845 [Rhizobium sp. 32-5/1]|uniref:hypothetical protein n=1 Tax=Rhizobium sp. 32-5/1 TaxID=3019602 RepID=UPI00240DD7DE|nr:hypothetical protein [Rhizobium sp. 32-5/1]WEZ84660.1 hypothetical protein P6U16_08845 [Rhizobium sp. 32-5/1]